MTRLFISILNMSLTASIVAIVVMLARVLLKKSPKIFSMILWGVVLFHLVCPFSFESTLGLLPEQSEPIPQAIVYTQEPAVQSGFPFIDEPVNSAIAGSLPPVTPENSVNPIQVVLGISAYIWAAGIAVLLLYAGISYFQLKRRVLDATLLQDNVYETDSITTAFVLGFFAPKIFVPCSIKPGQLAFILQHETSHITRRDYLVKPLAFFALMIHWFNPLIWVSFFLMSKDMEMACDESVLRKSGDDIRRDYSAALLQLSSKRSGIVSPLAFGENNVRSRIKNILNFKKPVVWIVAVSIMLVLVLGVGLITKQPSNTASLSGDAALQESPTPADVCITIKDQSVTATGLTAILSNTSRLEYTYGEAFALEKKQNGTWVEMESLEDAVFHAIGYILAGGQENEIEIRWNYLYGTLGAGEYRVSKEVLYSREPGDYDSFVLYGEFMITSPQPDGNAAPIASNAQASLSPDGKTRIELTASEGTSGMSKLSIIDMELGTEYISYDYPPDTQLAIQWSANSKYAAFEYNGKNENRIIIYVTDNESSAHGKGIYSPEFPLQFTEIVPAYTIRLIGFASETTLLYSLNWQEETGENITHTVDWDFTHGTYEIVKNQ